MKVAAPPAGLAMASPKEPWRLPVVYRPRRFRSAVARETAGLPQEDWLSGMDSNHDKELQRLLCYHYTTGQDRDNLTADRRRRKAKRPFPDVSVGLNLHREGENERNEGLVALNAKNIPRRCLSC